MKKVVPFSLGLALAVAAACQSPEQSENLETCVGPLDSALYQNVDFPSPLENMFLLQGQGVEWSDKWFGASDYPATISSLMFRMGELQAQIAACYAYEKGELAAELAAEVVRLSREEEFGYGQFFAAIPTEGFQLNDCPKVVSAFNLMDVKLRENGRGGQSIIFNASAWLATSRVLAQAYGRQPSAALRERIGEQKLVQRQLADVLRFYVREEGVAPLHQRIVAMDSLFEQVRIVYEPIPFDEDNHLVPNAPQMETSRVVVDEEAVAAINQMIENAYAELSRAY